MSYYCKGEICPRAKKCLRAKAWDVFPKNGTTAGLWFVPENTCIKNDYEDGVFKTDKTNNKTMDKQKLIKAYKHVEDNIIRLWHSQGELSRVASVFYGKNVDAEICAGGEIEFRLIGEDEIPDSDNTIRIEDILNKQ